MSDRPGEAALDREVVVLRDGAELGLYAAHRVERALTSALQERPGASLVLSGGSTPLPTYDALAERDLAWDRIDLYWGDERCVPPGDPASNFRAVRRHLLDPARVPEERIHRIPAELGGVEGTRRYERLLRDHFPRTHPGFDIVLLGVGSDGHTASLFPGSEPDGPGSETGAGNAWVVATRSPEEPAERISLTDAALVGARRIFFLVSGRDKAEVLARILEGGEGVLPAARVAAAASAVTWLLDPAAASALSGAAPA